MTMNINNLYRGFCAPSNLAQASAGYDKPWTLEFLKALWQWVTGATREIKEFKAKLPLIIFNLELRRESGGLSGEVDISICLSERQSLRLVQSADGQQVWAALTTIDANNIELEEVTELVNGFGGPGSILEQLELKLAREFGEQFLTAGSDVYSGDSFHGHSWSNSQAISPWEISDGDLFVTAQAMIFSAGESLSLSARHATGGPIDEESFTELVYQTMLGDQRRREAINYKNSGAESILKKNTPSPEISAVVRAAIKCRLGGLSQEQGLKSDDGRIVSMVGGSDVILSTEFNEKDAETEWCLLPSGPKTYTFITFDAAQGLIKAQSLNPFNREPITANSFIRGEQLLAIVEAFPKDSESSEHLEPLTTITS